MRSHWPILAMLCLLASLLVPGTASASTASGSEPRVWAFDLAEQVRVGVEASLTLELHPGCEPTYDQLASDSLLAARGGVRILEREGDTVIAAFNGARGEARVATTLVRDGDTLNLRGTHIEGEATLREALDAARQFGREQGASRVIIEGGVRTTGANPGHVPRSIVMEVR